MAKNLAHCVSSAEKKRRVFEVFEMIIASKSSASIVKFCVDKWDVRVTTAYRYISLSNDLMKEHLQGKRKDKIRVAIHQREHIIEKLMGTKQYAAAVQALADKNKLENLYETDTHDVTVDIQVTQK